MANRDSRSYLGGLAELHQLKTDAERIATWRQSMAALAAVTADTPVPLEGLNPGALNESVRVALRSQLVRDLDWLSPPAAAAALYELAAALPPGQERRFLGRDVLTRMHEGNAATFVAVATRLALGSPKGLTGGPVRARVALALELPVGVGTRADALALALISRRELEREWLIVPSTGSLPSRRLAARLLERAAREAARRASEGDDSGLRVFASPEVRLAWSTLLADRESLVWRHVACARGLLCAAQPNLTDEIERDLDPARSPTEWRRAAASLTCTLASSPERTLSRCRELLRSEIPTKDPGVAAAMISGLAGAVDSEPSATEALLRELVGMGGIDASEALVELHRERVGVEFGARAASFARAQLRSATGSASTPDDGRSALVRILDAELSPAEQQSDPSIRDLVTEALLKFAETGARDAFRHAATILTTVDSTLSTLEGCTDETSEARRASFKALRALDVGLFETSTLHDLLALGGPSDAVDGPPLARVDSAFERTADWVISRESQAVPAGGAVAHLALRLRRLRTWLHLVDADGAYGDDQNHARRDRQLRSARALLRRVYGDAPSPLSRTVCAAAARACDSLVRCEVCELSDVLIAAGLHLRFEHELLTFAEASMVPEFEQTLRRYAALTRVGLATSKSIDNHLASVRALHAFAEALPAATSSRVDAFRRALLSFSRSLEAVRVARSLREIADLELGGVLVELGSAAHVLSQLVSGAKVRLGFVRTPHAPALGSAFRAIDVAAERRLHGHADDLAMATGTVLDTMRVELPLAIAETASQVLSRIPKLPLDAPFPADEPRETTAVRPQPLPDWLPPSRALGGFYVQRPLGNGAGGSVFVVTRLEERTDRNAEQFALKVPEYNGEAARTLSEKQFMQLFRDEAGALLSIPAHPNLARFVTFDVGAKPKPILVMELVEGPSLARAIETRELSMKSALNLLEGVARGLEAMHEVGVAHLDIKPWNVILRRGAGDSSEAPVLVDFGLAGRKLRPGCATSSYGAPEIWGAGAEGDPSPLWADVYALACVVFETLTCETLFEGISEYAVITAHVSHDGDPPKLAALATHPACKGLCHLLSRALRHDPRQRASISEVRSGLTAVASTLANVDWPVPLPAGL